MYVTAIVLAAGRGLRFGSGVSKPLSRLGSQPILIYSLSALSRHPHIKDIIVVANPLNKKGVIRQIKRYRIGKIKEVVLGGRRRQDSVRSGLKAMGAGVDYVLIHDAARPFIDKGIISCAIGAAEKYGSAISGVPVSFTVKEARRIRSRRPQSAAFVKRTIARSNLWEIQTPQVFKAGLITRAYKKFGHLEVTDDASLVEKLKERIAVVPGSYFNIKITTRQDALIASGILKNKKF